MTDDAKARRSMLDSLEAETDGVPARGVWSTDTGPGDVAASVSFASAHPATCVNLTRLAARLERELRGPLDMLREQRINHVPVLAYPNGDHTDAVVAAARAVGYSAAVTTSPGLESRRPADLFRLKRIGVHDDVTRSVPLLALHVARQAGSASLEP
jgi:hypothetical protein